MSRDAGRSESIHVPWDSLVGGKTEDSWSKYGNRKYEKTRALASERIKVLDTLVGLGATTYSSAEVLLAVPGAASWYVAMAGFASNHIRNLKTPEGMSTSVSGFLKKMESRPEKASRTDLEAFSSWVNTALEALPGGAPNSPQMCLYHVAVIDGSLIVGRVQNESQYIPHYVLKEALLRHFGPAELWGWKNDKKKDWQEMDLTFREEELMKAPLWYYKPTDTSLDFGAGGERPDIKITRNQRTVLAGEIKGRMDVSNLWESWLPQATSHMASWSKEYPQALRGVFMTIFTKEAVDGKSDRPGLKKSYEEGALHFAINLFNLMNGQVESIEQFKDVFTLALGL